MKKFFILKGFCDLHSEVFLILKCFSIEEYHNTPVKGVIILKHCPVCNSDDLDRSSAIPLRVIAAIILTFIIPMGVFIAWIPFLLPYAYLCRRCGNETKEEKLMHSDWRERTTWIEKEEKQSELLSPLEKQWFDDGNGPLKKVIYFHHLWIAYSCHKKVPKANVIHGYDQEEGKLILGGEVRFPNVKFPAGVSIFLTEKELEAVKMDSEDQLRKFTDREGILHKIATETL